MRGGTLTKIEGVPDRSDAKAGMAYFANTGPFGTTCGDCRHRGYAKGKGRTNACAMYWKLTVQHGGQVDKYWASCKYFEPR
jgi:hypothetical protein